jgi:hypothetical protein
MNLSREWKLLLACARTHIPGAGVQKIKELVDADLDWDYVAKTSCSHGIAPLVYHGLQQSRVISLLPFAPAERLRSTYYGNAARNALLYDELHAVLTMLKEQGSDVIVLKGAALAETVYPHRALRAMSDIDLLVRRERLAELETRLREMGYVPDERRKPREWFQAHHYHLVFANSSRIPIEIHWHVKRPEDPFGIDIDGFWKRARSIPIAGVQALVLSPADLLIHLCQHLWQHSLRGGIRPLCDIAEVIKYFAADIDWTQVAQLSSQWQTNSCLYVGFGCAAELLDAPVPKSFLDDLKPADFNPEVLHWVLERLLAHGESSLVSSSLLQLFEKGRSIKDRWAVAQRALSQKSVAELSRRSSPAKATYLWYPLRVKYLLTRHGRTAWRLATGGQRLRTAAKRDENLTKWLSSV